MERGLDELRIALKKYIAEEGHTEIDNVADQALNVSYILRKGQTSRIVEPRTVREHDLRRLPALP